MCGIAGYRSLSNRSYTVEYQDLEKVQAKLSHRGPDGYRIWFSPDKKIGLVHRRLSIVDLSQAGFQPFFDPEKSIAVMCNGEIYNHLELRKEFDNEGYPFSSQSDTETIVALYKKYGIDGICKLAGDFALVIVDFIRNELYLIRDRMGVKPLYFSFENGMLSFSSEIKALWPFPWMRKSLNVTALHHYLTFMVTPAPMTLYEGVYKLPAGYYLKVDQHDVVTFNEWYNPLTAAVAAGQVVDEQEAIETIDLLFKKAVQKRLMSDVVIGSFLSGGIDSSLIVSHMSSMTDNVKTFNISFSDGSEYSEVKWARRIAKEFKTDHYELTISEKEAFDFFQSMIYYQDEPLADCVCIPLYYVAKLLRDTGVTVVLVGEGADELFAGYSSYGAYVDTYNRYWQPATRFIPSYAKKTMYALARFAFPHKPYHLALLDHFARERSLFWGGAIAFPDVLKKEIAPALSNQLIDPVIEQIYPGFDQSGESYAVVDYHLRQLRSISKELDFLNQMIYLELKQRLPELLLMRLDKMSMATSVEGRVPFLDHELVEYSFRIPGNVKYRDGVTKSLLKKVAARHLPPDIVYRKKIGFAAPTLRWFKEGSYFKPYFLELLREKKAEWGSYINFSYLEKMYEQHYRGEREASVQLWTVQNLIAGSL